MSRLVIGWDTETHLVTATDKAPPLVCMTMAGGLDSAEAIHEAITQAQAAGGDALLYTQPDGEWALIAKPDAAGNIFVVALTAVAEASGRLVAHSSPFDWGVMCRRYPALVPMAFAAVEKRWATDTRVREMLWTIATDNFVYDQRIHRKRADKNSEGGGFSLAELALIHLQLDVSASKKGPDVWRLRYAELENVPLKDWPKDALEYALDDARLVRKVYLAQSEPTYLQAGTVVDAEGDVTDEAAQVADDWALHLIQLTGAPVDPAEVVEFTRRVEREAKVAVEAATEGGWRTVNNCKACRGTGLAGLVPDLEACLACDGDPLHVAPRCRGPLKKQKNDLTRLKAWITYAYGGEPPRKKPTDRMKEKGITRGNVMTSAETCDFSGLPILKKYASGLAAEKLRNTYVPILRQGALDGRIHPRFNVLVRTGRTSCAKPNMQNPPRLGGFRECFRAPPDQVFCSIDYKAHELATLAQVCINIFGESLLAQKINEGLDPHLWFALTLLKTKGIDISYAEAARARKDHAHPLHKKVKYYRQVAKVCDFGYPGGLGAATFVTYARGYDLVLTPAESEEYKAHFLAQWPVVGRYLKEFISGKASGWGDDRFALVQHHSGRIRGGCKYTTGANTLFQGLAADGIKAANYQVAKRQWTEPDSTLWGTRTWNLVHDELLLVGPETTAHEWAYEATRVMVDTMQEYTPDVVQGADPALMYVWDKDADTVLVDGRLVPWTREAA